MCISMQVRDKIHDPAQPRRMVITKEAVQQLSSSCAVIARQALSESGCDAAFRHNCGLQPHICFTVDRRSVCKRHSSLTGAKMAAATSA